MSEEGKEIGLIDEVVSSAQELLRVSRIWALDIVEGRKCRTNSLSKTDKLTSLALPHPFDVFNSQTHAMPHHKACLDAIRYGIVSGGHLGLSKVYITLLVSIYISRHSTFYVHGNWKMQSSSKYENI